MRVRVLGTVVAVVAAVLTVPTTPAGADTVVPHFDHIVVMVEENHSRTGVLGNPDAPFLTSLADDNANFVQSFAETHPSEPNYLALFSGGTQGLTDDSCPHTYSAPSLGDSLIGAGLGFAGYSEDLPATGYTGCYSGKYVRKHNPWVNFPAIPASANKPMSAFPSDFSTLPDVSFVIPNLQHDMHDGTIAEGDAWARDHVGPYIEWAKTHNSLFVLTFDEDDFTDANRIPTVLAGQHVVPGVYDETINHYSVLRTIADSYGLAPVGNAATTPPITDVWSASGPSTPPTAEFTSTCTRLTCLFDGGRSSDPDGHVTTYAWDFGDGTTGSGRTPRHTFIAAGERTVTLTVTDNSGTSGTPVGHPVAVRASAATVRFVAAGNGGGGNTRTKQVVVPTAASVGDVALLFLSSTTAATWTGPPGWGRLDTVAVGSLATAVWTRTVGPGDPGSTVRFTSPTYSHAALQIAVYSGVDPDVPVSAYARAGDSGRTSHATPAVFALAGDLAVSFWGASASGGRSWTLPSGSLARDTSSDSGSPSILGLVADPGSAITGETAGGVTATNDGATTRAASWTLVLHAAPGVDDPPPTTADVAFVAAADAGGGNARAKSVAVPISAHPGDTAVLTMTATSKAVWNGPSGVTGWSRVDAFVSGSLATTVWVKRLVAADPGARVRFDSATYTHASVQVAVYSGVDPTAPVVAFAHTADAGTSTHPAPSVPASADQYVVSFWGASSAATRSWTLPFGLLARDSSPDSGPLSVQGLVADAGAAGGSGGVVATTDGATSRTTMWTLALRRA